METQVFCGMLAVLLCICCAVETQAVAFGDRLDAVPGNDDMATFCVDSASLRRHLANKLPDLQNTLSTSMHPFERELSTAPVALTSSAFAERKTLSDLREDAAAVTSNLRCMGRALDIHRYPTLSGLYPRNALPDNVQLLRFHASFQRRFRQTFRQMQQLETVAVESSARDSFDDHYYDNDDDADGVDDKGGCAFRWSENPSYVLILSHGAVTGAQHLVDDVSDYCRRGYDV